MLERASHAWGEARRGLASPWVVLQRARTAGAPFRDYLRLVRLQLLLTLLVMAAATPFILEGLQAATSKRTVEVAGHKVGVRIVKAKVEVKKLIHDEEPAAEKPDEDGAVAVTGHEFVARHAPSLLPLWLALVSLYGAWMMVELAISALWREHGDQLSDAFSHAAGLEPGPYLSPRKPRIRLDMKWIFRRIWRQVLGAIVFASGAPFFLLASLFPRIGTTLYAIVLGMWGLYWLLVTTASKSSSAWRDVPRKHPWFLLVWGKATTRVPGFRWAVPRAYGVLWYRVTVKMHGASEVLEQQPYAIAGLAVVRILGNLPVLSLLVRPLLPVAAELVVRGSPPIAGRT